MKRKFCFKNGKFKVMQIADTQDTQRTSRDTVRFLDAVIEKERPDLIIFTGDQIKGYGFNFIGGDAMKKVNTAIKNQLAPLEKHKAVFAATFGNHDSKKDCNKEAQDKMYCESSVCAGVSRIGSENKGVMSIPLYSGDKPVFNFYIIDTPQNAPGGVYSGADAEQLAETAAISERLRAENGGKPLPSMVFQHIPVPEMYALLKKVPKKTKGAVLGNKANPEYYVLREEYMRDGAYMHENIASPVTNTQQFAGWLAQGDVVAAYFGHDHINCFSGEVEGIELGYTPGAGFNVYGPGLDRAVRVFEFSEEAPADFKTRVVTYRETVGKKITNPLKYFIYTHCPSSISAAKPLFIKCAVGAAVIAAGIAAVCLL